MYENSHVDKFSKNIFYHYDQNKNVIAETQGLLGGGIEVLATYTYNIDNLPVSMTRGGTT